VQKVDQKRKKKGGKVGVFAPGLLPTKKDKKGGKEPTRWGGSPILDQKNKVGVKGLKKKGKGGKGDFSAFRRGENEP